MLRLNIMDLGSRAQTEITRRLLGDYLEAIRRMLAKLITLDDSGDMFVSPSGANQDHYFLYVLGGLSAFVYHRKFFKKCLRMTTV